MANAFDQFDKNAFDQFEPSSRSEVPGREGYVALPNTPDVPLLEKARDALVTAGGVAQNTVASVPAMWLELANRMAGGKNDEAFNAIMSRFGYSPRTPNQQQYMDKAGEVLQNVVPVAGLPGEIAMAGRAAGPVVSAAGNAASNVASKVGDVAGGAKSVAGKVAQGVVGIATGVGPEAFKQAYKAGKEGDQVFADNMRGNVPVEQVLEDAKRGLLNMQTANSAEYGTAKQGWAADQTKLDLKHIDDTFSNLQKSLNVKGHSLVGDAELAKISEVEKVLDEWRGDPAAQTALGLDALKRRLDAIYPDNPRQAQAQRVIAGTRSAVKDTIVRQVPEYADAMKSYESQLSMIRNIEKALSLGNKAAQDTAIRKLQSLTRNNVNTNYGYRQSLAEELKNQGGVDVMPAVAGQALNTFAPRGLARLNAGGLGTAAVFSPGIAATLPLTSPRLMGEAFYGAGKAANASGSLVDILRSIK